MKVPLSLDTTTGSVRLQPTYFDGPTWFIYTEAKQCDWPQEPPLDAELRALESRWQRWWRTKAEMDAEWKSDAERRLALVPADVERDTLLFSLEAERTKVVATTDGEIDAYLGQLLAVVQKSREAWLKAAQEKLRRATEEMNRDIVRREKERFLGHK